MPAVGIGAVRDTTCHYAHGQAPDKCADLLTCRPILNAVIPTGLGVVLIVGHDERRGLQDGS